MLRHGPLKRVGDLWCSRTGQLVAHGTVLHLERQGRAKVSEDRKEAMRA
jgi:hypothetical protein